MDAGPSTTAMAAHLSLPLVCEVWDMVCGPQVLEQTDRLLELWPHTGLRGAAGVVGPLSCSVCSFADVHVP